MKTLQQYRNDFPYLCDSSSPLIYFDTAATAQKPYSVIQTLSDFYSHRYGTVNRGVYTLAREATESYQDVRRKVQKFIHAEHFEEIIFTRGTTHSLNLLANSFSEAFIQPGDVILLSEIEHHSNLVPWQMVSRKYGAELKFIPVNEAGELILEAFYKLLDDRVKLVTLAHISNVLGTLHPVKKIIEAAHKVGAYVCLDGAQSAPHLPLNVQELDVDFYAFSGHKLYGPTGVGVLYGKRELLEQMPPVEGGGDMIERVTLTETTYAPLPAKFEAGTPMIAEVIGLGAALDYLTVIGMETIAQGERKLLDYATQKLSAFPDLRFIGTAKEKGGILSFVVPSVHPLDIATLLDCRNIAIRSGHHCSQPAMDRFKVSATCRLSFGLYNTFEEIDQFTETLKDVLGILTN